MKRYWSKEFGPAYFVTNTIVEWKNILYFQAVCKDHHRELEAFCLRARGITI